MGFVNDAQVLRMCQRSYQRNQATRLRLDRRLEIHRAIEAAGARGWICVRDDLGRLYTVKGKEGLDRLCTRLKAEGASIHLRLVPKSILKGEPVPCNG